MPTGIPLVGMGTCIPLEPHDRQCRIARSVGQGSPEGRRRYAPPGLAWSEHGATLSSVGGATARENGNSEGAGPAPGQRRERLI